MVLRPKNGWNQRLATRSLNQSRLCILSGRVNVAAFSDLWQPHAKVISGARRKSTDPTDGNLHILKPISALTT